jgi:hypothetical protein
LFCRSFRQERGCRRGSVLRQHASVWRTSAPARNHDGGQEADPR